MADAMRRLEHATDVAITEDVVVFRDSETGTLYAISGMLFEALSEQRSRAHREVPKRLGAKVAAAHAELVASNEAARAADEAAVLAEAAAQADEDVTMTVDVQ